MRKPDRTFTGRAGPTVTVGTVIAAIVTVAGGPVSLADPDKSAAKPAEAAPEEITPPLTGPQVYIEVCIACHAAPGIGGAPALGDGDAWATRIDQGKETLVDHALRGYSGNTGIMPMKGGRLDLSDEEITAAVEYMVEQVAP